MNGPDEFRDEELSRRYRALPPELPQPDTDAVIRAAARKALATPRYASRQRVLLGGLAMAASVTLVMALLLPSWRSGEWQAEVATRAPVAVVADAPEAAGTPSALPAPVSAEIAPEPAIKASRAVPVYKTEARAGSSSTGERTANHLQEAVTLPVAPAPVAAPAPVPDTESAEAVASDDVRRELATAGPAATEQAAREAVATQKARAARPLVAAPAPAAAGMADMVAPTLAALLREGRHAEALAVLQSESMAGDAGLESRRDLLRQLVPGTDRTLRCGPDSGPASARALCRLLQEWQAGKGVPAADRQALEQAWQAEGVDPLPWRQALMRLP